MNRAQKADFSFEDYKILHFEFLKPKKKKTILSVGFEPTAIFYSKNSVCRITLKMIAYDEREKDYLFIKLNSTADFKFYDVKSIADIPPYFYANSIAILFPYLRAFVSTLTLQANWTPLILPLINLSDAEDELKASITESLADSLEDLE